MTNTLEIWKAYNKKVQKMTVRLISESLAENQRTTISKTKDKVEFSIIEASLITDNANKNLQKTIQGQFGSKVTLALEKRKNILKHLRH